MLLINVFGKYKINIQMEDLIKVIGKMENNMAKAYILEGKYLKIKEKINLKMS